jgi:hypothetical protein
MPRVDYTPVPSVKPQERAPPREQIHIDFPGVRFTDAIGQAMGAVGRGYQTLSEATKGAAHAYDQLGNTLQGVGNEMWQRAVGLQELENETKTSKAMVEFGSYETQQREEVNNLRGDAASSEVLAVKQKEWEAKRNELREKLPPTSRRAFDSESIGVMGRLANHAATHFSSETRKAAAGAANAEVDMAVKEITEAEDMETVKRGIDKIERKYNGTIGPAEGMRPDEIHTNVMAKAERGLAAMITRISESDPTKAKEIFEANKSMFITPNLEQQVTHSIEQNRVRQAVRVQVDRNTQDVWNDKDPTAPRKTEAERIKEAIDGLPDDIKDNKGLMASARTQIEEGVIGAVRRQESAARNERVHTFDSLTALIYGPNGELRRTPEEIWAADPKARTLYSSLPPTGDHSQKGIRDAIDLAIRKGERIDPFVSGQSREYLTGLANGDAEHREKLMNMNLWDPNLKDEQGRPLNLNLGDRKAAIAIREKLRARPDGDPRVDKAWKWLSDAMGQEMSALGLVGVPRTDPNYIRARGALGDAIDAYKDTHKGMPPDRNAIIKEIAPEFLRHTTGAWYTLGFGGTRPGYEKDIPEEWADKYKKGYKAGTGEEPSESEIFNAYWYTMWEQFYQGKAAKGKTPEKPATTAKPTATAPEVGE